MRSLLLPLIAAAAPAFAHITLPPGGAAAGSDYEAAFRVGHACKDTPATTAVTVRLPEGFTLVEAQPRAGWALSSSAREVRWTADAASALPDKERAEFIVRGKLTAKPGTLWFAVRQDCGTQNADWAQLPGADASAKLPFPAARLDVLAPGIAAVDVKNAWARPSVAGQSGTGAFMQLSAPQGLRLVGVATPAAGVAELHEMKMEGDTMRMRELKDGLALPARQTVELKPGGYHLMLMDLKQPLAKGTQLPLTLRFVDAKGVASQRELQVPVGVPEGAAGAANGHVH
ncbi:copper chaperone PCu(A)C [Pseudorhodoferax sp.]|uniref:copper chaperone PCu(A)C n=1 Tax=Pseudorhodoferax sp. TaxID=1993553 RepID=UPI002DD69464|nr:copper chaperone PCu(A)C [Pseudorhodoferax sp.]